MSIVLISCDQSEGVKSGVLQKVPHKKFPASYYEVEIAYQGGRVVGQTDERSGSYSNTQSFKITKECYDTIQKWTGYIVVFEYNDDGFKLFGPTKSLKSITVK